MFFFALSSILGFKVNILKYSKYCPTDSGQANIDNLSFFDNNPLNIFFQIPRYALLLKNKLHCFLVGKP